MVTNHPSQIATAATTQTRKFMTRCPSKLAVSTLLGYSHLAACSSKLAVSTPLGNLNGGFHQFSRWEFANS